MNAILSISDVDHGKYHVFTRHSQYNVNLDAGTIQRQSNLGYNKRGDLDELPLHSIHRCEVGYAAVFAVADLPGDEEGAVRVSTEVLAIEVAE